MSEESVDHLYTTLEDARVELQRRRNDPEFRARIDAIFGTDVPDPIRDTPKAVLSRTITTPNLELFQFKKLADEIKLQPTVLEFPEGKFVARNWEKYSLCRLSFVDKEEPQKRLNLVERLVNFNDFEGKNFTEIKTQSGVPITTYHHDLLKNYPDLDSIERFDFSKWFLAHRGTDSWSYYLRFLGLFFYHGVLFENFLTNNEEKEFTEKVVLPSFRIVEDVIGCKPLIVRLAPKESEAEQYWCYYYKELKTGK